MTTITLDLTDAQVTSLKAQLAGTTVPPVVVPPAPSKYKFGPPWRCASAACSNPNALNVMFPNTDTNVSHIIFNELRCGEGANVASNFLFNTARIDKDLNPLVVAVAPNDVSLWIQCFRTSQKFYDFVGGYNPMLVIAIKEGEFIPAGCVSGGVYIQDDKGTIIIGSGYHNKYRLFGVYPGYK